MVHADLALGHVGVGLDAQAAHIVHGRAGAGVAFHVEVRQRQGKGEAGHQLLVGHELAHRLPHPDVHQPVARGQPRDGRSGQDDKQGHVDEGRGHPPQQAAPHHQQRRGRGQQRPQGREPGRAVDVGVSERGAPYFFGYGGRHQHKQEYRHEAQGDVQQVSGH